MIQFFSSFTFQNRGWGGGEGRSLFRSTMDITLQIVTSVIQWFYWFGAIFFALAKHLSSTSYRRLLGNEGSLNLTNLTPHVYIMSIITRLSDFFSASVNLLAVYTNRNLLYSLHATIKPVLLPSCLTQLIEILCP